MLCVTATKALGVALLQLRVSYVAVGTGCELMRGWEGMQRQHVLRAKVRMGGKGEAGTGCELDLGADCYAKRCLCVMEATKASAVLADDLR